MIMKITTLVLCLVASAFGEDHWALLVAGSNGYENYRHQADICHAYHVVRNHGIPDEQIVVMMYDDIANNDQNPFKGNIINSPDGPNVYPGVLKDYVGEDVTSEVFLKVLTGDSEGIKSVLGREGKVIKSGPDDRVFVNFADHGGAGILAFPNDGLLADDLHNAIKKMHENNQYKQMVFYVEACESGSMFADILESNINVYVTTAANSTESSYACYFDDTRKTPLGDVYSVMWMEDSDREDLSQETLQGQFELVRSETNQSHVSEFGDLSMGSLKVANFQGNSVSRSHRFSPTLKYPPTADAVPSEDVPMYILKKKLETAVDADEKMKYSSALQTLLQRKQMTEDFFKHLVSLVTKLDLYDKFLKATIKFSEFSCYKESLRLLRELCPGMKVLQNDYALRKLRVLANMCEANIPKEQIWSAIGKVAYESPFCAATAM